jgi:hypothetical protein
MFRDIRRPGGNARVFPLIAVLCPSYLETRTGGDHRLGSSRNTHIRMEEHQ